MTYVCLNNKPSQQTWDRRANTISLERTKINSIQILTSKYLNQAKLPCSTFLYNQVSLTI